MKQSRKRVSKCPPSSNQKRSAYIKLRADVMELSGRIADYTAAVIDLNDFLTGQEKVLVNRMNALEQSISKLNEPRSSVWDMAPVTTENLLACMRAAEAKPKEAV